MDSTENEQFNQTPEKDIKDIHLALDIEGDARFVVDKDTRYVLTDTGIPTSEEERKLMTEDATLGFEIVPTSSLPTETRLINGKEVTVFIYEGQSINPTIKALFVDRSRPTSQVIETGGQPTQVWNFKGMRTGEEITPAVVRQRFGKDVPFSVQYTEEGELSVSNPDTSRKTTVLGFGEAQKVLEQSSTDTEVPDETTHDAFEQAVLAAKAATAIEAQVDVQTKDAVQEFEAERKESLSVEEIKEIGDEGLDAAGVDDPAEASGEEQPREEGQGEALRYTYEQQIAGIRVEMAQDVAKFATRLEEHVQDVKGGDKILVQNAVESLARINSMAQRSDDYPTASMQTELRNTLDRLYSLQGITMRFGEGTVGEMKDAMDAVERQLASHAQDASQCDNNFEAAAASHNIEVAEGGVVASSLVGEATDTLSGLQDLRQSLNALDTVTWGLAQSTLRPQIGRLEDVLQQSYSRPIDIHEIMDITKRIQTAFESDEVRTTLKSAGDAVQSVLDQARQAAHALNPHA